MDTLTLKIHEYDADNHCLIVSFGTDAGEKTVDEYEKYSFEIHNYNPDDIADTIKQIAQQGAQIAHRKYMQEQSKQNEDTVTAAQNEVGKVYNFQIADLLQKDVVIT
mgnify:CR=1 FL=1